MANNVVNQQIRVLATVILSAVWLTACSAPVSSDFRARVWEKCFVAGEKRFLAGDYDGALALLKEADKQAKSFPAGDQRYIDTELLLGNCFIAMKKPADALVRFDALSRGLNRKTKRLDFARALLGKAHAENDLGKFGNAETTYRTIIGEVSPESLDSKHGYDADGLMLATAYEGLADTLVSEKQPQQALQLLKQASQIADWTVALVDWKSTLRYRNLSMLWALGRETEALNSSPNKEWADVVKQANRDLINGDQATFDGRASYADALIIGDLPESNLARAVNDVLLANSAYYNGRYADAAKYAKAGLEIRSKDPLTRFDAISADLHDILGLAEEAQGHLPAAAEHFKKAFELQHAVGSPAALKLSTFLSQLAVVEYKGGHTKDAERDIARALAFVESGHRGIRFGIAQYWIARYFHEAGNDNEARPHAELAYGKLIMHHPNHLLAQQLKSIYPNIQPKSDD